MTYVDAHLHLADSGYSGQVGEIMADAAKNSVERLLSNAVDYESSLETVSLAKRYNDRILAAVGVHPWTVANETDYELDRFEGLVDNNREYVRAIGEIGEEQRAARGIQVLFGLGGEEAATRRYSFAAGRRRGFGSPIIFSPSEGSPALVHRSREQASAD